MPDVLREHTDPYQKCTCGWRRFRGGSFSSSTAVTRWVFYDTEAAGFGASEFGTYFGSGGAGAWGEFDATLRSCGKELRCENCRRLRLSRTLSNSAVIGAYIQGSTLYVVTGDVTSTGCLTVEFRGTEDTLVGYLKISTAPIAPLLISDPPITGPLPSPPAGASVANVLLATPLPSVAVSGDYEAVLVDRCCGYELSLGTFPLEVDVVVLNPGDADLSGAPEIWLQQNWLAGVPTAQPQSGSAKGIPLDKCDGVIEYDARFGVLPDDASFGFAHAGTGLSTDYALVPGGVMQAATAGGGADSYWTKTLALASSMDRLYAYAMYRVAAAAAPGPDPDEGLTFLGRYSIAADNVWRGVRFLHQLGALQVAELDAATDVAWAEGVHDSNGWNRTALANNPGESKALGWHNGFFAQGLTLGTDTAAPLSDELVAHFGDIAGEGLTADIRNFVVSAPGRFLRPWFRGYATKANPVLRLYVSSDLDGSAETLARFLVRYGSLTDPYGIPTGQASASLSLTARNQIFEVPINLSNLTPNQPFWFTVERDWAHADDRTRATVWLMQATVRGA
jgi:hypothetical protein